MIIYTIATLCSEIYGHGDSGKELKICKLGSYGSGDFPVCFRTEQEAYIYLNRLRSLGEISNAKVVELRLTD